MEAKKLEYKFSVEVVRAGQPRSHADSEYEHIVESDLPEHIVKAFCTSALKMCSQEYKDWNRNNADSYFRHYYTFEKIKNDKCKYRYYEKHPYTG